MLLLSSASPDVSCLECTEKVAVLKEKKSDVNTGHTEVNAKRGDERGDLVTNPIHVLKNCY